MFELVCGRALFYYTVNTKFDLTETENMLYQMMVLTGQEFRAAQLSVSPSAIEYFDPQGCEFSLSLTYMCTVTHIPLLTLCW